MKKLLLLCSLALFVTAASATPLTPGSGPLPATDFGSSFFANGPGNVLAFGAVTPFSGTNAKGTTVWTGQFQTAVLRDHLTGHLDFVYQFSIDASSLDGVPRMTATDFSSSTVDAGYSSFWHFASFSGTVAPVTVDRFSADTVGFNFNPTVKGQTSYLLVIRTNASGWTTGTANFLDGGEATLDAYAPTAAPEPASLTLLVSGLMMFGFKRFRK